MLLGGGIVLVGPATASDRRAHELGRGDVGYHPWGAAPVALIHHRSRRFDSDDIEEKEKGPILNQCGSYDVCLVLAVPCALGACLNPFSQPNKRCSGPESACLSRQLAARCSCLPAAEEQRSMAFLV